MKKYEEEKIVNFISHLSKDDRFYISKIIIWLNRIKKLQNNINNAKSKKIMNKTVEKLFNILENKINDTDVINDIDVIDDIDVHNFEYDNSPINSPINFSKIENINKDPSINILDFYCNLNNLNDNISNYILELFIRNYIKNGKNIFKTLNDVIIEINELLT